MVSRLTSIITHHERSVVIKAGMPDFERTRNDSFTSADFGSSRASDSSSSKRPWTFTVWSSGRRAWPA